LDWGHRGHVVEKHLHRDPSLESSQAGSGTHVRATSEGEMAARIGAIDPETAAVVKVRFVSVGRRQAEGDLVVGTELPAV
jgi:hypothetical protein